MKTNITDISAFVTSTTASAYTEDVATILSNADKAMKEIMASINELENELQMLADSAHSVSGIMAATRTTEDLATLKEVLTSEIEKLEADTPAECVG